MSEENARRKRRLQDQRRDEELKAHPRPKPSAEERERERQIQIRSEQYHRDIEERLAKLCKDAELARQEGSRYP